MKFLKIVICVLPFFLLLAWPAYEETGSIAAVFFYASLPALATAFFIFAAQSEQDYIRWAEEENAKLKGKSA